MAEITIDIRGETTHLRATPDIRGVTFSVMTRNDSPFTLTWHELDLLEQTLAAVFDHFFMAEECDE